jgi:signal transduction histidine kinase
MVEPLNPEDSRILLVDDTPANIDVLSETLQPLGYNLAVANSGEKALKVVTRIKPDLILLDVMMPGMSGFETCRELKNNPDTTDVPVIFITAKTEPEDINEGFRHGAVDYITKPFRDEEVLARVRTHILLKKSRDRLEDLNSQKDRFIGIAAHDLRSPLSGLLGYIEMLSEECSEMDAAERQEMFARMDAACAGMLDLVDDLLDVTTIGSGNLTLKTQPMDLVSLVNERCNLCDFAAGKKDITLDRRLMPTLECIADERRISQVIDNLITNAIKFSPPGTAVTVEVFEENNQATVAVQDEGPGLTEEDMSKLFRDFQQLSARPTGGEKSTGLGLAISNQVIVAHGGKIYAEPGTGSGARFIFQLPLGK